jgi:hypothetical protein
LQTRSWITFRDPRFQDEHVFLIPAAAGLALRVPALLYVELSHHASRVKGSIRESPEYPYHFTRIPALSPYSELCCLVELLVDPVCIQSKMSCFLGCISYCDVLRPGRGRGKKRADFPCLTLLVLEPHNHLPPEDQRWRIFHNWVSLTRTSVRPWRVAQVRLLQTHCTSGGVSSATKSFF